MKRGTYGRVWLNKEKFFKTEDKQDVENYAKYILWFVGGGLCFWLTLSLLTNKTTMPALLIFLAL